MRGFRLSVRHALRAVVMVSMTVAIACGDAEGSDDEQETPGALGVDDGASRGESRNVLVRGDRDVSLALSTGASVLIPAGAVTKPVNIGIKRPKDSEAVALVASVGRDRRIASAPYVVTPHGTQFEKDVKLTLPVANVAAGRRLQVAWLENEQDRNWKVLGPATAVDRKVVVPIKHFSVLVLLEEPESDVGEADAGTDFPVELPAEAGVQPEESDGGGQAAPEDAGPSDGEPYVDSGSGLGGAVDGGVVFPDSGIDSGSFLPDASLPDGAAASGYAELLYGRLAQCQALSRQGEFRFTDTMYEQGDSCELQCLLEVSCASLTAEFCYVEENDEMTSCWARCMGMVTTSCVQEGSAQVAIRCDGHDECVDGSDELGCPTESYFFCSDGSRIAAIDRCDGRMHCVDGSDEAACQYGTNLFSCGDGEHVPRDWECDGYSDCANGADEGNCAGQIFTCDDGERIRNDWVCNGVMNCEDGSDEPARCIEVDCGLR